MPAATQTSQSEAASRQARVRAIIPKPVNARVQTQVQPRSQGPESGGSECSCCAIAKAANCWIRGGRPDWSEMANQAAKPRQIRPGGHSASGGQIMTAPASATD